MVTPLVYYKNTQPIVRSQTRENTRLRATTACKSNRGVFLYSSGKQPSFSCSAAATVLPAELWSSLHLLFPVVQQPQSCLQSCGAVSTFFSLQCSSHSPACRVVERSSPSFSCSAAATVLPAELWSGPTAIGQPCRHQAVPLRSHRHQAASPPSRGSSLLRKPVRPSPCWGRWIKYSDDAIALPSPPSCGLRRLLRAALAVFMRPSPPSCGPRRLHATLTAFIRPSPPSCNPRRLHAALAAFMRPSPPLCGPCRLYAALAAFMRPSPPSYGHSCGH